jgi:hypothetical protein
VITGRGPGAPSVTPDVVGTLGHDAHGQTADLGAIRRTDALVDLLATRRLRRPRALGDPAVTLLYSLSRDVDSSSRGRPSTAMHRARARRASRRRAEHRRRPGEPWVRTVAAVMVFTAAAVAAAGLLVVGMVTRLTLGSGRGRARA